MGEYLFGPDSMMWKINREQVLLLGGRGALLMQLAHPLVAAGVADHSDFRADPLGRLRRTLDSMLTIIFGTTEEALGKVGSINALHSRVRGHSPDGRPYLATEPDLLLWVYSTLADSSVRVYEACVATLTEEERARYYEETKVIAELFGIPLRSIPDSLPALRAWMDSMIERGDVVVTDLARELAEPILRPLRIVPSPLARRAAIVTAALLPPPIREGYGLTHSWTDAALLAVGRRAARLLVRGLPGRLRTFPAARAS